jgi:hypothetical protein
VYAEPGFRSKTNFGEDGTVHDYPHHTREDVANSGQLRELHSLFPKSLTAGPKGMSNAVVPMYLARVPYSAAILVFVFAAKQQILCHTLGYQPRATTVIGLWPASQVLVT